MGEVVKTWPVPGRGTGRPDYMVEVARGNVKQGVRLLDNEMEKVFFITMSDNVSVFPWVIPPVAVGGIFRFVDMATGTPVPYTVTQGYNFILLAHYFSFEQPVRGDLYISMPPFPVAAGEVMSMTPDSFGEYYEQEIIGCELNKFDPTLATAHQYDITGTNMGVAPVYGSGYLIFIERIEGSAPFPKTKTVRCHFCGATKTVKTESTMIKCGNPECGKTFFVQYHPPGGRIQLPGVKKRRK